VAELRTAYHGDLQRIDNEVVQLFALVKEGVAGATDVFLTGDREMARVLIERDRVIDGLHEAVQDLVVRELSLQSPMATDLRFLLSVLRIVPELERSGDLAEHIASSAARGLWADITPRARGIVSEMGRIAVELWRQAAEAYGNRDGEAAERLDGLDDELDALQASLWAEAASGSMTVPVAMEMALIARFYERLGDHAVNIARRIRYLATGVR
jgi:phosphate transport system protein